MLDRVFLGVKILESHYSGKRKVRVKQVFFNAAISLRKSYRYFYSFVATGICATIS